MNKDCLINVEGKVVGKYPNSFKIKWKRGNKEQFLIARIAARLRKSSGARKARRVPIVIGDDVLVEVNLGELSIGTIIRRLERKRKDTNRLLNKENYEKIAKAGDSSSKEETAKNTLDHKDTTRTLSDFENKKINTDHNKDSGAKSKEDKKEYTTDSDSDNDKSEKF